MTRDCLAALRAVAMPILLAMIFCAVLAILFDKGVL